MKSLSDSIEGLLPHIEALKEIARQKRESGEERERSPLKDFRNLNSCNLEELDHVYASSARFECKPLPYCGRCAEGFQYTIDSSGNRTATLCDFCERPRRRMKRLNDLNLPADSYGMNLDRYEWDSADQRHRIDNLLTWMKYRDQRETQQSPSVYMWGRPGNGKTSLLYALAKEAVWNDFKVEYTSHTKLIEGIKRSFNGKDNNPLESWLDRKSLLLLDEFGGVGGAANQTPWFKSVTADMIQKIYEHWQRGQLSVVMTTNLTPHELFNSLDRNMALISRLQAIFNEPLQMIGADRRIANSSLNAWGVR
jgi:DNA replication protein DnaC